jgi:hypothetical protein
MNPFWSGWAQKPESLCKKKRQGDESSGSLQIA